MDYLSYLDFLALVLTFLGTVIVVKSKLDLGICHTWAGYCKQPSELEVSGIYAYIRHPLYTGIHLFSVDELLTLALHAQWYLTLIRIIVSFIRLKQCISFAQDLLRDMKINLDLKKWGDVSINQVNHCFFG